MFLFYPCPNSFVSQTALGCGNLSSLCRARDGEIAAMQCGPRSNCDIHSSGRLKTAVDVSAEERVKITLFLVCNCKFRIQFAFFIARMHF